MDIHAGSSSLYDGTHAPVPPGANASGAYLAPIPLNQGDPHNRRPSTDSSQKGHPLDAREDGTAPSKSRGCTRRKLVIGLLILLVVLTATLGGALGATLGKHSSNSATKTSSSVPISTETARTTTITTTTSTLISSVATATTAPMSSSIATSTTSTSSPVVTPQLHYVIKNSLENLVMDLDMVTAGITGWDSNGGLNQQWLFESAGDDSWYIRSATNAAQYINYAGSLAQEDHLVVATGKIQSWIIETNSSSPGTSTIRHPDTSLSLYIYIPTPSTDNATDIQLWYNPTSGRQNWVFTPV